MAFVFHPELFERRSELSCRLAAADLLWFRDYSSVDLLHEEYGLEVCGIRDASESRRVLAIMRELFPDWPYHCRYLDEENLDPGWRVGLCSRRDLGGELTQEQRNRCAGAERCDPSEATAPDGEPALATRTADRVGPELFLRSAALAPTKKFRGRRRHFRRLHQRASRFRVAPSSDDWWALWHDHADWRGWGNLAWSFRLEYWRALATVFRGILDAAPRFTGPFQTWILLDTADSASEAVYLHTPNPVGAAFPLSFSGPRGSSPWLESLFQAWVPAHPLRAWELPGVDESGADPAEGRSFLLFASGVGSAFA